MISLFFISVVPKVSKSFGTVFPYLLVTLNMFSTLIFGIFLLKVDIRNTRTIFEICSKLTIKTPERRQWRCFGVFIVNFERISNFTKADWRCFSCLSRCLPQRNLWTNKPKIWRLWSRDWNNWISFQLTNKITFADQHLNLKI